jgi:Zn finger protein HypA/HybF involved in hydrogenase expression
MHETGLIRALIEKARAEATARSAELRGIHIRLGALAGGTAAHLREHFEHELERLGLTGIALHVEEAPAHPAGVELTGLELAEKR